MKKVAFGQGGPMVSQMCLGTMMFGKRATEEESDRILSAALDQGVNFVDTAAMYCEGITEQILGRILRGHRDKVFLGTKVHKGVDYASITTSVDESLKRLQTDYVDLYMIHWPKKGMALEEVMRALNDVVKAGKARHVGCCNYPAWLFCRSNAIAAANGWPQLVGNQLPYNPVERGIEVEVLPQCRADGAAVTIYRAMLMGLLSGKYHPDQAIPTDSRAETDDRIGRWLERFTPGVRFLLNLAKERGVPAGHVAVAWVRSHPAVTCTLVGPSRLDQLQDSLKAFDFELSPPEREAISKAFGADVKEESGGAYAELRRELFLTA